MAWATLGPKKIDLNPKQAEAYFEEIGAPESLRRAWERSGGDKFHETNARHMKTFVRVGDAPASRACLEPAGLTIEFLPDRDPTTLVLGDTLVVSREEDSFEIGGLAVGVLRRDGATTMLRSNKAGYVRVPITHGGWWLLRGTELRRTATAPGTATPPR